MGINENTKRESSSRRPYFCVGEEINFQKSGVKVMGSGIWVINLGKNFRSRDRAALSATLKNYLGQARSPKIVKILR